MSPLSYRRIVRGFSSRRPVHAASSQMASALQFRKPTSVLHRTPWRPPVGVSADGIYITLDDGRRLLDAVGGAAVACIGHIHPAVIQAIKDQLDKLSYVYSMQLSNEPAEALAQKLVDTSRDAFAICGFASGGSEAMDGVIKLGRQSQRTKYISRQLPFHGNTTATLSLAYHPARRAPYEAILYHEHFYHVSPAYAKRFQRLDETEAEYVERLRLELDDKFRALGPETVIGFVAETVVGATTGVVPPPRGYLKYGALFILDEVMSGMGRMGTLHAWVTYGDGICPDIQAVAKGLLQNIQKQGAFLESLLIKELTGQSARAAPFVFDIRGRGGFWAVEFDFESTRTDFKGSSFAMLVQARAMENGLIIMGMTGGANLEGNQGDHVILSPPYNVTGKEVEKIVKIFVRSVNEVLNDFNVH